MSQELAIKRPSDWLWSNKMTQEDVLTKMDEDRLSQGWLVCPFGHGDRAVPVDQFIEDPEVFIKQDKLEAERRKQRTQIKYSIKKPWLLTNGKRFLGLFLLFMILSKNVPTLSNIIPDIIIYLGIIYPFWFFGIFGVLFWAVGKFQHRSRIRFAIKKAGLQN
ncbi:MAG: hypothetical protein COA78_29985 [Blastopirellula sp.]|nr:MAG: hypothetical protein COA78_29985 [Blastopirellula sp.]